MDEKRLFLISDIPGYSSQIGRLVSMMNYARWTTLEEVRNLSTEHLDYLHDPGSNSIGALLLHIAAVEVSYQAATFESRGLNRGEKAEWGVALDLGERARGEIRGYGIDYYIVRLKMVRERTLAAFAERGDDWLYEETPFWGRRPANNYFKWFHVFEDELNHRGQIRWISKRALGEY
jgi:uncharacterized damage-inducible protein DinB